MVALRTITDIVLDGNYVVLDTETTGLKRLGRFTPEIVQIAILSAGGHVLLDKLVHPHDPIPAQATAIHGITDEMCKNALTWADVREQVISILRGKEVIVYNAKYDRSMFHCSDEQWGLPYYDYKADSDWYCAMEWYANIYREPSDYFDRFKWQKLTSALDQQKISRKGITAHSALADCFMTLKLITTMTAIGSEQWATCNDNA